MQEAEDQDTCRICSAPAEEGQPLFHPCKCSGTIRYIHQDCLTTWLAHSKKKNCDVCKHPYSFTKVYAPDMPSRLPIILVIKRLIQQVLFGFLFLLRGAIVAVIWLGLLPWVTVWAWRMYFSLGDSIAWLISSLSPPESAQATQFQNVPPAQASPLATTFIGQLTAHPRWIALSADIFMGQIIASLIVLIFVAVFLLREWISQNARPGVFDDDELPQQQPAPAPVIPVPPRDPPPPPAQDLNELHQALAQRQIETLRVLDVMRARDGINGHMVGDARIHGRSPLDRRRRKGKAKQSADREDDGNDVDGLRGAKIRALEREIDQDVLEKAEERNRRKSFSRRILTARLAGARRKATLSAAGRGMPIPVLPGPMPVHPSFEFTFKPPADPTVPPAPGPDMNGGESASIFPRVTLEAPRAAIPYSFDQVKSAPSSPQPDCPTCVEHSKEHPHLDVNGTTVPASTTDHSVTPPSIPSTYNVLDAVVEDPEASASEAYHPRQEPELEAAAGPSRPLVYLDDDYRDGNSDDNDSSSDEEELLERTFESEVDIYFAPAPEEESSKASQTGEMTEDSDLVDDGGANVIAEQADTDVDEEEDEDEEADGEANGHMDDLFGDNDEEEDNWDDADARVVEMAPGVPPAGGVQGAVGENPDAGGIPGLDRNEEAEANVEDDMEGAMEAIGIRGPIYGVFQNAALMIFVLDTALGLGIFLPFTIGKTTALLSLNPPRFVQILHLPIRAIRIVTDPIVDSVVFFVVSLLFPPFKRLLLRLVNLFLTGSLTLPKEIQGSNTTSGIPYLSQLDSMALNFSNKFLDQVYSWSSSTHTLPATPTVPSKIGDFILKTEPRFAVLGMHVRVGFLKLRLAWKRMAFGDGPAERTFVILLGYVVTGLILAIYLNILTVGNARSAGRAVRSAVRQQLLVLKVATFIFIELVTFPLTCGIILDVCTVWMFPKANFGSRLSFVAQAPLTSIFYHWVAGTMFMYTFALLLSSCRKVMRPGAMWFIKDPQDQNSHPIRDILDRPTLTQLRKICVSGFMYACVVGCTVGSAGCLFYLGNKSIMPFRWKNREPLSNVPVDLLFLHLVLPYTMHYFRPKKAFTACATVVWKDLARRLRLTSYFFGDRHPAEEEATSWWRILAPKDLPGGAAPDGSFRRVPATDHISLPRDMRATVQVTEGGEPANDKAKELMIRQNIEVAKAKRSLKDEFMVVYIPPNFRYRIICFICALWLIGAAFFGVAIAVPVQLGRSLFQVFTSCQVHDGYSLIVGFYLLWIAYLVAVMIDRVARRRQRMVGDGVSRAHLLLLIAKRGLVWFAKATYMAICLGVVVPALIAFVVDLYIILPVRFVIDPKMVPRIWVVDSWALGLLYMKIGLQVHRLHQPGRGEDQHRILGGVQRILANGWTKPDPVQATKEVIAPLVFGLMSMIVVPGAVFRAANYLLPSVKMDDRAPFMHVYPGIFVVFAVVRSAVATYGRLALWSQAIRDKEFLVEMRLRNHDPEKMEAAGTVIEGSRGTAIGGWVA